MGFTLSQTSLSSPSRKALRHAGRTRICFHLLKPSELESRTPSYGCGNIPFSLCYPKMPHVKRRIQRLEAHMYLHIRPQPLYRHHLTTQYLLSSTQFHRMDLSQTLVSNVVRHGIVRQQPIDGGQFREYSQLYGCPCLLPQHRSIHERLMHYRGLDDHLRNANCVAANPRRSVLHRGSRHRVAVKAIMPIRPLSILKVILFRG